MKNWEEELDIKLTELKTCARMFGYFKYCNGDSEKIGFYKKCTSDWGKNIKSFIQSLLDEQRAEFVRAVESKRFKKKDIEKARKTFVDDYCEVHNEALTDILKSIKGEKSKKIIRCKDCGVASFNGVAHEIYCPKVKK